jgi:hypothetical protein
VLCVSLCKWWRWEKEEWARRLPASFSSFGAWYLFSFSKSGPTGVGVGVLLDFRVL